MEHVERVLRAVNLKEPDRVPIDLGGPISGIHKIAYERLKDYLGYRELPVVVWDVMQQLAEIDERILNRFDVDFRHLRLNPPSKEEVKIISEDCLVNEFGLVLKRCGYYFEMVEEKAPLHDAKSVADVERYKGPEPHEGRLKGLREKAKELSEKGFAVTFDAFTGGILELAVWLRGFKKFYYDFVVNPEFSNALLDKALEIHKRFWEPY